MLLLLLLLPAIAGAGVANPDGYITYPGGTVPIRPGLNDEGFEFISFYTEPLGGTVVPDFANDILHYTADLDWRGFDSLQYGINIALPEEISFRLIFVYPHPTDFNYDGMVDDRDLSVVLCNWRNSDPYWADGDVTADSKVDDSDLSVLLDDWGPVTWRTAETAAPGGPVPEPTSLAF